MFSSSNSFPRGRAYKISQQRERIHLYIFFYTFFFLFLPRFFFFCKYGTVLLADVVPRARDRERERERETERESERERETSGGFYIFVVPERRLRQRLYS